MLWVEGAVVLWISDEDAATEGLKALRITRRVETLVTPRRLSSRSTRQRLSPDLPAAGEAAGGEARGGLPHIAEEGETAFQTLSRAPSCGIRTFTVTQQQMSRN